MALTTAKDYITDALLKLGVIAIGEAPDAPSIAQGMNTLQSMLDAWQSENMALYTIQPNVMPFDGRASGTYTVGAGGDMNIQRPSKFDFITIRNSAAQDFPCQVLDPQHYSAIVNKSVQSSLPYQAYPDMAFPLINVTFYPVPSDSSYSGVFWLVQPLSSPVNLTDTVAFPPSYGAAITFNLPTWLGPAMQIPVSNDIKSLAIETKANFKRANIRIPVAVLDPALTKQVGYTQQDFLAGK